MHKPDNIKYFGNIMNIYILLYYALEGSTVKGCVGEFKA